jgi:hypothetical protein
MGRKSRDHTPKSQGRIKANIFAKVLGNSQAEPLNLKSASKQENTKCQVYDCEIHKLIALLADLATGIWRIKNKLSAVNINGLSDDAKKAYRHIESTWDALTSAEVEVRDHTKEKYVAGMALNVVAFQPSPSVHTQIIIETIKPSIFYNSQLIQMGDVIVAIPENTQSQKSENVEGICKTKEGDKE